MINPFRKPLIGDRGAPDWRIFSYIIVWTRDIGYKSGSDRFCIRWHRDHEIGGIAKIDLHHLRR